MLKQSALLLCILYIHKIQTEPLITISQGCLKGTTFKARNGRNISEFLAIPYAQPPVEELRFKSPEPAKAWDGIRPADKEANICPQPGEEENNIGDEDCLYLNVFTPFREFNSTIDKSSLLPVMVWIHQGGFYFGHGGPSFLGPNFLLSKDIVLVTMNYRLGILGFLTTGDSVAPGNFGLKDQVLALKWVQKNIKSFGGDSNKVTIFGESAGGASVNFHALSKASNGLFHQYIIQSGCVLGASMYRKRNDFKPNLNTVAKNTNCSICNSEVFVNCLRKRSAYQLLDALKNVIEDFPLIPWIPTDEPESKNAFLIDSPRNLVANNKMKDLPFISGTVADEGLIITSRFLANLSSLPIRGVIKKGINSNAKNYVTPGNIPKFEKVMEDYYFSGSISSLTEDQLLENYTKFLSDSGFFYPDVLLIEKAAKVAKSPFYSYSYGYRGNNSLLSLAYNLSENIGVSHADDLLSLFPEAPAKWVTKNDKKIIDVMLDMWTSFAKDGKPTSNHLDNPNLWLPYNLQNKNFLQIGNIKNNTNPTVTLAHSFFVDRMNFWKKNVPVF